jgi:hypothetical protein
MLDDARYFEIPKPPFANLFFVQIVSRIDGINRVGQDLDSREAIGAD